MTIPRAAGKGRASTAAERIATGLGIVAVVAFIVAALALRTAGVWFGGDARSPTERSRMLEAGDCALGLDRKVVGKVVAQLGVSREHPRGGYQLEAIDQRRMVQVDAGDVTITPCASLE